MAGPDAHDALIHSLSAELAPVQRLPAPSMRALAWLAGFAVLAIGIAWFADLRVFMERYAAAPDLPLSLAGSVLTALLAAIAAFQLSVPGRPKSWALLPLPAALLWIGASGVGCLRSWIVPGMHDASLSEAHDCFWFILSFSIPLSIVMIMMLRRAAPLYPALTAAIAGLACAAAAASLLALVHNFDATGTDLAVHAAAVMLVIGVNMLSGGRLIGR